MRALSPVPRATSDERRGLCLSPSDESRLTSRAASSRNASRFTCDVSRKNVDSRIFSLLTPPIPTIIDPIETLLRHLGFERETVLAGLGSCGDTNDLARETWESEFRAEGSPRGRHFEFSGNAEARDDGGRSHEVDETRG